LAHEAAGRADGRFLAFTTGTGVLSDAYPWQLAVFDDDIRNSGWARPALFIWWWCGDGTAIDERRHHDDCEARRTGWWTTAC
jgi:hypothetical protein